jgi:hypothetical protein
MSVETQAVTPVLEWCLPVIHDCLHEFYHDLPPAGACRPELLTERHFALWSALALEDFDHLPMNREKLAAEAIGLRVDARTCRAADLYVAAEIFEMIQRRFRRVTHEAHANHAALLALLRRLQLRQNLEAAPVAETRALPAPKDKPAPLAWAA